MKKVQGYGADLRALELFCGMGGFAAATAGSNLRVVGAFDQDQAALATYRLNFSDHVTRQVDLGRVGAWELTAGGIDFWWLSPPCQPYCERGVRRDLVDPRAHSLAHLIDLLGRMAEAVLPRHFALENVVGFVTSEAHRRLTEVLTSRGYHLQERLLCPTELGIPSRRPRYYLAASLETLRPVLPPATHTTRPLSSSLALPENQHERAGLLMPPDILARFGKGLHIIDPDDLGACTTCFTSGYGRSLKASGSYLQCAGGVRRFSPEEIVRLLHFPEGFRFPGELSLRQRWSLVGNSLSVAAVREVLRAFPALQLDVAAQPPQPCSVLSRAKR